MLMITTLRVMVVNLESNGDIREYCDIESEAAIRHIESIMTLYVVNLNMQCDSHISFYMRRNELSSTSLICSFS